MRVVYCTVTFRTYLFPDLATSAVDKGGGPMPSTLSIPAGTYKGLELSITGVLLKQNVVFFYFHLKHGHKRMKVKIYLVKNQTHEVSCTSNTPFFCKL